MPGVGSWFVHIDGDRRPVDEDGVLVDGAPLGENPLEGERAEESSALGGYPAVADRELGKTDEPAGGADGEGLSVDGDDGVLHTESLELDSLDE